MMKKNLIIISMFLGCFGFLVYFLGPWEYLSARRTTGYIESSGKWRGKQFLAIFKYDGKGFLEILVHQGVSAYFSPFDRQGRRRSVTFLDYPLQSSKEKWSAKVFWDGSVLFMPNDRDRYYIKDGALYHESTWKEAGINVGNE